MSLVLNNVAVSTATTGTGTVTLGAAIANNFFTMSEAGGVNGAVYSYRIDDGTDVEIGIGTYNSSTPSLSRDTVTKSKISGTAGTTKLTLSGSAVVRITAREADFPMGRQSVFIPAAAMTPRLTNGPTPGRVEMTTNKNTYDYLEFDQTTQQFAHFYFEMPKGWDLGTVSFKPHHMHASGSGNVVYGLAAVARSNDDPADVAFGTPQTSDRTVGTANDVYIGPESSAITVSGSPAVGDGVQFEVNRTVASDNLNAGSRLVGVTLFFNINAANDN